MAIKVSVVVPVYNAERYLRQCLDSIVGQSLREIELICVDDGSTDGSAEILAEYAALDERVLLLRQENAGAGAARNRGLAAAKGEYVLFLDSDDWFELDYLEMTARKADAFGADVTICRGEQFDSETGKRIPSQWMLKEDYLPSDAFSPAEISEHLFQFTYGMVWDKLYRRSFLSRNCLTFPVLRNSEDTAFSFISLLDAEVIAVLPQVKVHYRVNRSSSVSSSFTRQPEAPFEAFALVKAKLDSMDNAERYRRSFLNWAMEYLVWQVCNMPDREVRRVYFDEVKNHWFPELGLEKGSIPKNTENTESNFHSDIFFVEIKCLLMKKLPFSLFSSLVSIYKQFFSRRN